MLGDSCSLAVYIDTYERRHLQSDGLPAKQLVPILFFPNYKKFTSATFVSGENLTVTLVREYMPDWAE